MESLMDDNFDVPHDDDHSRRESMDLFSSDAGSSQDEDEDMKNAHFESGGVEERPSMPSPSSVLDDVAPLARPLPPPPSSSLFGGSLDELVMLRLPSPSPVRPDGTSSPTKRVGERSGSPSGDLGADGHGHAADEAHHAHAKSRRILEEEEREKMQVLVSNFTEEQLDRYEMFRRSAFPKAAIKRLMMSIASNGISQNSVIAMSGLAKVYVGEVVEEALDVMEQWGESGPLKPKHLREAVRRLRPRGIGGSKPGVPFFR